MLRLISRAAECALRRADEAFAHLGRYFRNCAAVLTIHEDRRATFYVETEQRLTCCLFFRDRGVLDRGIDRDDVHIAYVVGDYESGTGDFAVDANVSPIHFG